MAKNTTIAARLRSTAHPILYEVNTRVLLRELSSAEGMTMTLADVPDRVLDEWADLGIDAVWLMGVWTTGDTGREIARSMPVLLDEYRHALPDFTPDDIQGSPYAVKDYRVAPELGGNTELRKLRARLARRGIGLILDCVFNHTARDHAWVIRNPERYINGRAGEENERPEYFFSMDTAAGPRVLAYGRDPLFPGWTDTAQLNIFSPATRLVLYETLESIAGMCDGVRCDMAMLLLNEVFIRTWGDHAKSGDDAPPPGEFWKEAIEGIHKVHPDFLFIAEAYWNKEWDLQQFGFRYTYDKTLYDRLLREGATAVRDHLRAEMIYQSRCLRFLENHDEQRVARALPSESWQYAAATVVLTLPGGVLLHEGQLDGRAVKLPVQLVRRQAETVNPRTRAFYAQLLQVVSHPVFREGSWQMLNLRPSWHDNHTWYNFLVYWWQHPDHGVRMVVVNYAPHTGQCYAEIPLDAFRGNMLEFRDLLGTAVYVRERAMLEAKGVYFDLPSYGIHIFDVTEARKPAPAAG